MDNACIQPYQQTLDFFTAASWQPRVPRERRPRIVSGGRTGVDRAALDAASGLGLAAGDASVHDSDATLILTLGPAGESRAPAKLAQRQRKPYLVVQLDAQDALEKTRDWLAQVQPRVLNVAGPRVSKQPAVYGRTFAFLSRLLRREAAIS